MVHFKCSVDPKRSTQTRDRAISPGNRFLVLSQCDGAEDEASDPIGRDSSQSSGKGGDCSSFPSLTASASPIHEQDATPGSPESEEDPRGQGGVMSLTGARR
ncbi:hypothetical protein U1Q18_037823 [Sarracenia purpurea var. burkii]